MRKGSHLLGVLKMQAAAEAAVATVMPAGDSKQQPAFNSVLVNRYEDGTSQVAWHSDDEKCYGPSNSILIASVSLGARRYFEIRRKPRKGDVDVSAQQRKRFLLQPGSLLVMAGPMQAHWQHSILADNTCTEPRINLTFRRIVGERRRGE